MTLREEQASGWEPLNKPTPLGEAFSARPPVFLLVSKPWQKCGECDRTEQEDSLSIVKGLFRSICPVNSRGGRRNPISSLSRDLLHPHTSQTEVRLHQVGVSTGHDNMKPKPLLAGGRTGNSQ